MIHCDSPERCSSVLAKAPTWAWKRGFALDEHTISSVLRGYDEFGHEVFETKRTELGELLYRLKYRSDNTALRSLVATAAYFIRKRDFDFKFIVPVPPSRSRQRQPVVQLANALSKELLVSVLSALAKSGTARELKSIHEFSERIKLLEGALCLASAANKIDGANVLLFDDLWRSGATLNASAQLLRDKGHVGEIMALTITKTRSNK